MKVEHDFGAVEFYDDELKELAAFLDGSEYQLCLEEKTTDMAKEKEIVIVYGMSDDLMEFEGAWYGEIEAYEGTTVTSSLGRTISAIWCANGHEGPDWSYKTDIPHEIFRIMEDGNIYCEGIVFHSFPGETWEGGY
ncbi:MAG: hypothetical protein RSD95_03770 [Clostridia bacterium]